MKKKKCRILLEVYGLFDCINIDNDDVVRFGNYRQRRVIYGDVGTQFVIDRGVILALVGVCN